MEVRFTPFQRLHRASEDEGLISSRACPSKIAVLEVAGREKLPGEFERELDFKSFASEQHHGEEAALAPDVQRDPGVDQRQKRIEARILGLADARRRVNGRLTVTSELQVLCEACQVRAHCIAIDR